jgi:hypothetical protein
VLSSVHYFSHEIPGGGEVMNGLQVRPGVDEVLFGVQSLSHIKPGGSEVLSGVQYLPHVDLEEARREVVSSTYLM